MNTTPTVTYARAPEISEDLRRRWAEAAEQERQRQAEFHRQANAARARAIELLHCVLDDEQRHSLDIRGLFRLVAPSGREYEIEEGYSGNVYRIIENVRACSYCAHPVGDFPTEDMMLTQYLTLMHDEAHFLETANPSYLGIFYDYGNQTLSYIDNLDPKMRA